MFDIPVALFLFRRSETLPVIISRLREVKPVKLYLLADEGRNEEEMHQAHSCRAIAESLIDWDCEIVKNYAAENRGVYKNIGEGAKWVFEREKAAIFLEDDNLPETTFFEYAKELLSRYENDPRILWICGTNYYTEMQSAYSYEFTQHLLPCGWASWGDKFTRCYDGELKTFSDRHKRREFMKSYKNKWLALWRLQTIYEECVRKKRKMKFHSWDYQMIWSIRSQNLLGIVPMRNQITNIGVDNISIHGTTSKKQVMTDRFCEVPSLALTFPLVHPDRIAVNETSEKALAEIICPPHKMVLRYITSNWVKKILGFDMYKSWKQIFGRK